MVSIFLIFNAAIAAIVCFLGLMVAKFVVSLLSSILTMLKSKELKYSGYLFGAIVGIEIFVEMLPKGVTVPTFGDVFFDVALAIVCFCLGGWIAVFAFIITCKIFIFAFGFIFFVVGAALIIVIERFTNGLEKMLKVIEKQSAKLFGSAEVANE